MPPDQLNFLKPTLISKVCWLRLSLDCASSFHFSTTTRTWTVQIVQWRHWDTSYSGIYGVQSIITIDNSNWWSLRPTTNISIWGNGTLPVHFSGYGVRMNHSALRRKAAEPRQGYLFSHHSDLRLQAKCRDTGKDSDDAPAVGAHDSSDIDWIMHRREPRSSL